MKPSAAASTSTKKDAPAAGAAKARKPAPKPVVPVEEDDEDEDDDMEGGSGDLAKEVARLRRTVQQLERSTSDVRRVRVAAKRIAWSAV